MWQGEKQIQAAGAAREGPGWGGGGPWSCSHFSAKSEELEVCCVPPEIAGFDFPAQDNSREDSAAFFMPGWIACDATAG